MIQPPLHSATTAGSFPVRPTLLLAATLLFAGCGQRPGEDEADGLVLASHGTARAVIVIDAPAGAPESTLLGIERAALLFQRAAEKASAVKLPVVAAHAPEAKAAPGRVRVLIGGGEMSRAVGAEPETLEVEEFRIRTTGDNLLLYGRDSIGGGENGLIFPWGGGSFFAVARFLDRQWGARYLWPGDLGLYVPQTAVLKTGEHDTRDRPFLEMREMGTGGLNRRHSVMVESIPELAWLFENVIQEPLERGGLMLSDEDYERILGEAFDWQRFHLNGQREKFPMGHNYQLSWLEFGAKHPEWFAQPPPGFAQPWPRPSRVKLSEGNEAIDEAILQKWREAGRPAIWGVSPQDSAGFCTSPASMAMDTPPNQDPLKVWRGEGRQTARMVRFWTRLMEKFRAERPDVRLVCMAYMSYRDAPPEGMRVPDGMVVSMVARLDEQSQWNGWANSGAVMVLRPNWFHVGGSAPLIRYRQMTDFLRNAHANGLCAARFDSTLGYWTVQGLNYYAVARALENPHLTADDILREYLEAFGGAAPAIREYFAYWDDYAERAAYAGHGGKSAGEGLYQLAGEQLVANTDAKNIPGGLRANHELLPWLYPDAIIDPARKILDRAKAQAGQDAEVIARIEFLAIGLEHLALNRDTVALGQAWYGNRTVENWKAWLDSLRQLIALRENAASNHALWAERINQVDLNRTSSTLGPAITRARGLRRTKSGKERPDGDEEF